MQALNHKKMNKASKLRKKSLFQDDQIQLTNNKFSNSEIKVIEKDEEVLQKPTINDVRNQNQK